MKKTKWCYPPDFNEKGGCQIVAPKRRPVESEINIRIIINSDIRTTIDFKSENYPYIASYKKRRDREKTLDRAVK